MTGERIESGLEISAEISEAVAERRPVVALETTLVTHGFPRPTGLEMALELEAIVRRHGAVPATIGVLHRRLIVGLTRGEMEELDATRPVEKLNPSNLAAGITSGRPGSTTVAATMIAARLAGLRVLATGGIGGVHRHANETGDVSADLAALARHPVVVVCAGAKAVLDLPRTLETLESHWVPVLGYRTDRFPAFYRRDSGLPLDRSFDDPTDLVAAIRTHFALPQPSGVVVANPIAPQDELPAAVYEQALDRALLDLERLGLRGRAVTPFLLEQMRLHTGAQSTVSNRALLRSNARLAAELARGLTELDSPPGAGDVSEPAGRDR